MIETLTDKQREVLALVADNRTSKEIARAIGVSESAVNQRIEAIRRQFGGLPRAELARAWREHSGATAPVPAPELQAESTCNPLTGQFPQLPQFPLSDKEGAADGPPTGNATTPGQVHGSHPSADDRISILPAALQGPQGAFHRLVLIAVMAAAMLVAALSGLTIVEMLSTMHKGKPGLTKLMRQPPTRQAH